MLAFEIELVFHEVESISCLHEFITFGLNAGHICLHSQTSASVTRTKTLECKQPMRQYEQRIDDAKCVLFL